MISATARAETFARPANETSVDATIATHELKPLGVTFFLTAFPLPIINQSGGLAADYSLTPELAVTAGFNQFNYKDDSIFFGTEFSSTNKSAGFGLRYLPYQFHLCSPFLVVGYQWGEVKTTRVPGLFFRGPEVSATESYRGAYGSLGLRFEGRRTKQFNLLADINLTYAPGAVKSANYVVDEAAWFSITKGHLDATYGYAFFPSAQIGASF